MADLAALRRQSLWLSRLTLLLFSVTALLLVTLLAVPALDHVRYLPAARLLPWLPAAVYLYALWAIRGAFRGFAAGGAFGAEMARGCARAGIALALCVALSAVGVPNLLHWLTAAGLIERLPGQWSGVLVFDVAYLAVGVVGLALALIGRLMRLAGEVQAEAAALREEVGGFF